MLSVVHFLLTIIKPLANHVLGKRQASIGKLIMGNILSSDNSINADNQLC